MLTRLMLVLAIGVVTAGCSSDPYGATRASFETPAAVFNRAADALADRDLPAHARQLSREDQVHFATTCVAVARWATSSARVDVVLAAHGVEPAALGASMRRLDRDLAPLVAELEPLMRARGKPVVFSPQDARFCGQRLVSYELDGEQARGKTTGGETVRFVREQGRWKLVGTW